MNEGYRSRAFNLTPKPKKKKKEEYKVCDFVDTMKEVEGSSEEEDLAKKAKSKAAREELVSIDPTEPAKVREARITKMERDRRLAKRKAHEDDNMEEDD